MNAKHIAPAARIAASAVRSIRAIAPIFLAAFVSMVCSAALARSDPSLAEVLLPRLQGIVRQCDLLQPARQPLTSAQRLCTMASDELRQRAHDGDNKRMLAWWRAQRAAKQPAAETASPKPQAPTPLSSLTPVQLKAHYLQCNRLAETTLLDFGTAAHCSMLYEELKQRVFGGDFQRLLAWSRQHHTDMAPNAADDAARSL